MKSKFYGENCYSFRVNESVFALQPAGPDVQELAAIEQKLIDAADYYYQRRYQDSIGAYNEASSLILTQLSPGYPPTVVLDPARSTRDPKLFEPLLNVVSQWLNVLTETPVVVVPHPYPPVEKAVLGDSVKYAQMGLSGTAAVIKAENYEPAVKSALAKTAARAGQKATPVIGAASDRTLGVMIRGQAKTIFWKAGTVASAGQLRAAYYVTRAKATDVLQLNSAALQAADRAIELPHDYYYVIPLGLAECYHALGDWARAEALYFQAAAYEYLNPVIEAPYLWVRLATLYADWGDSLFRNDQAADAVPVYQNVIMLDDTVPASRLYTTAALKPGADVARNVLAHLNNPFTLNVNPAFIGAIFAVRQQIIKIKGGLDFWGRKANTVPIWTFDYLQNIAINFAQHAINAEQEVINFWDRADQAGLTRMQITASLNQANAEVTAASLAADEARAEVKVYSDGVAMAQERLDHANAAKTDYESKSGLWIQYQALSQQTAGGDDGDPGQLNSLADRLMSGHGLEDISYSTLGAVNQLCSSRLNRDYEIGAMKRTAEEMQSALQQAKDGLAAANARVAAADAAVAVATAKAKGAQAMLDYFDTQMFTPDVWHQLGDAMMRLYQRYLYMALQVARLMQQAYNFETDQTIKLIKPDYTTDTVKGLLGADMLMADIQTFTYELITTQGSKPQPVRQTLSLASRYGFAFETQLRKTGVMDFETRIEDFDEKYPGTYAGRIEAVEVEIDGIVPAAGVSGALTNCGISVYRLPSASWAAGAGVKYRIQPKETLILSDYAIRNDALLIQNDQRLLKLFQGAGVSSAWRLELPRSINDMDYGALTDVRITFYYKARYDPDLRTRVIQQIATHTGSNGRQRGLPLRWVYPDAFFGFQSTGDLKFTLRKGDFPLNETNPVLTSLGLLFTGSGLPPLTVDLSTPGRAAVKVKTDIAGVAQSDGAPAWAPLLNGTAIGDYEISLTAADNPALVNAGALVLKPIVNISIILGYTYTPRA